MTTTEDVRRDYREYDLAGGTLEEQDEERARNDARFDRWLAEHDREVKAQALQEAADRLEALDKPWESPLYESTILWLRASAQQLKENK